MSHFLDEILTYFNRAYLHFLSLILGGENVKFPTWGVISLVKEEKVPKDNMRRTEGRGCGMHRRMIRGIPKEENVEFAKG